MQQYRPLDCTGINVVDTADFSSRGESEMSLSKAIKERRPPAERSAA